MIGSGKADSFFEDNTNNLRGNQHPAALKGSIKWSKNRKDSFNYIAVALRRPHNYCRQ